MQADMVLSYSHHVEGSLLGVQPRNQVEHLKNSPSKGLNLSCNFFLTSEFILVASFNLIFIDVYIFCK
jgi:hypothetical protein